MMSRKNSGFTLVEILIVVIILGILAAIVIPQFTNASNDAKDSALTSSMQTLRSQFELYKVQHNDLYPWEVLGAFDSAGIVTQLTTKTDADGNAGGDLGPYMQSVPSNPFLSTDPVFAEAAADGVHWTIDSDTGAVTDGRP